MDTGSSPLSGVRACQNRTSGCSTVDHNVIKKQTHNTDILTGPDLNS